MAKLRGYRAERMDPDYEPPKKSTLRKRYYHPTKGWKLPRILRRKVKAAGIKLA